MKRQRRLNRRNKQHQQLSESHEDIEALEDLSKKRQKLYSAAGYESEDKTTDGEEDKDLEGGTKKGKRALIVVDVQNDFCTGSLAVPKAVEIVPIINTVRHLFDVVVFTKDWHPPNHCSFKENEAITPAPPPELWPAHCVQETSGAELHPHLSVEKEDIIVQKGYHCDTESYSGFWDCKGRKTNMEMELEKAGVSEVFVCGLATDYCVAHTTADAVKAGYKTYLLLDASRGVSSKNSEKQCDRLRSLGVTILSTDELRKLVSSEEKDHKVAN